MALTSPYPRCTFVSLRRSKLEVWIASCLFVICAAGSASARETPPLRRERVPARVTGKTEPTLRDNGVTSKDEGSPPSTGVRGYVLAGIGAIGAGTTPIPSGGLTLGMAYEQRVGVGIEGACFGGGASAETHPTRKRASLLCSVSALAQWLSPHVKLAPMLAVSVGYAHAAHANPDESSSTYAGSGATISARAGLLASRRWLTALRVDTPLFHMTRADDSSLTRYQFSVVAEVGLRFPAR
jgi:hypothetical protein